MPVATARQKIAAAEWAKRNPDRIKAANDRYQARVASAGYCTYLHLVDGVVRYVGSGRTKRPTDFSNRDDRWHEVFATQPEVRVVASGMSRDTAHLVEQSLMWAYHDSIINKMSAFGRRREYDRAYRR